MTETQQASKAPSRLTRSSKAARSNQVSQDAVSSRPAPSGPRLSNSPPKENYQLKVLEDQPALDFSTQVNQCRILTLQKTELTNELEKVRGSAFKNLKESANIIESDHKSMASAMALMASAMASMASRIQTLKESIDAVENN